MRRFSVVVSAIFNYYFWSPIGIIAAVLRTGLTNNQIMALLPLLLILDVILPILIFFWLVKIGKIKDASLKKREERYLIFGLSVLLFAVSSLLSFLLANNLFFALHFLMFIMALTIFVITLFFKISGHMLLNAGFIFILNFLFGWSLLWLFLIVPIVAFARLYLKRHTPLEILAGVVVGLAEPILILKIFKLI